MDATGTRLISRGLPVRRGKNRIAIALVLLFFISTMQPIAADVSVTRDDFGVLETLEQVLNERSSSGEDILAQQAASNAEAKITSLSRPIGSGDALDDGSTFSSVLEMRDSSPLNPQIPRPYQYLTNSSTHPEDWPDNLVDTLFELPSSFTDPLAIGINTYAIYVNYTARNSGTSHEAWDYGTFTGDLISLDGFELIPLGENRIDLDGDGDPDISVGLTIAALGTQGESWDIEFSDDLIPVPEKLWIRPTFQWRVRMIDSTDGLWQNMERMEVSLMKGFAYNLASSGESYALVIDSSFTQPPYDFQLRVGLDKMEFDLAGSVTSLLEIPLNFLGLINETELTILSVSAPYSILISNPDNPGTNDQTECESAWYDVLQNHSAESREHRCGLTMGIGYVHFDEPSNGERDVLQLAYVDVGLHPELGENDLPEEAEVTLRNDNLGENSFDTVEIYSDTACDLWINYFEDRSNLVESDGNRGNITDSRVWIRGLPHGEFTSDEVNSIFTMLGDAPSSNNLPGDLPDKLSLIIGLKNFTRDTSQNVDDPTLPINPADPPTSLIMIVGTDAIDSIQFHSTFQRQGWQSDSSSMQLSISDLPEVLLIHGTFELPSAGDGLYLSNIEDLDIFSQFFDDTIVTLVNIVLDIGEIINGLPDAIVNTAGSGGGIIEIEMFDQLPKQVQLSNGDISERQVKQVSNLALSLSSSDHPIAPQTDHLILSEDKGLAPVDGRSGPDDPLVPIAISVQIGDISSVKHEFEPINEIRSISLKGSSNSPLFLGHLRHDSGTISDSTIQLVSISNRPDNLSIVQTPTGANYDSSTSIGSITYYGEGDGQRNAIRLVGLPTSFDIDVGDVISYQSSEPLTALEVQLSNASQPVTMDGDHARFWIDEDKGEASLSMRLSNITSIGRESPEDVNATGVEGNSRVFFNRSSSSSFSVLYQDETLHSDEFLGMNGWVRLEPLPADISFDYPSGVTSGGLELPEFGDEGVMSLSFFLGDLVEVGTDVNDIIQGVARDLLGGSSEKQNFSFSLDLQTGESFDLIADVKKGSNLDKEPDWVHGIGLEALERSDPTFNRSRIPKLTDTSLGKLEGILADGIVDSDESPEFISSLNAAEVGQASILADVLADGIITDDEVGKLNFTLLANEGVNLSDKRSYHLKSWLPQLPSEQILIEFEYTHSASEPEYEIRLELDGYQPERPMIGLIANGLNQRDLEFWLDGLDTSLTRDVIFHAVFSNQEDLNVPRFTVVMSSDLGERIDVAHAILLDKGEGQRIEFLVKSPPRKTNLTATIGDVLITDLSVPEEHRIGAHSAEALMIQMMRFVDGRWYPATAFMRDLPGRMVLEAVPSQNYDITEQTTFQGTYTLDYTSNTEDLDLYLEAKGRAVNAKGDILMLAENLPRRFEMKPTDDWGMSIATSGEGVEKLYLSQRNVPSTPGMHLDRMEVIGNNLKGATINIYLPMGYPVIVISDITDGRIVASADARVEVAGIEMNSRGALLDAQFTGYFPTTSGYGLNGLVADLSLVSSITGGNVETTHVLVIDPIGSLVATGIATLLG